MSSLTILIYTHGSQCPHYHHRVGKTFEHNVMICIHNFKEKNVLDKLALDAIPFDVLQCLEGSRLIRFQPHSMCEVGIHSINNFLFSSIAQFFFFCIQMKFALHDSVFLDSSFCLLMYSNHYNNNFCMCVFFF